MQLIQNFSEVSVLSNAALLVLMDKRELAGQRLNHSER